MTTATTIYNEKGNKKVTIEEQDGIFYNSVWVNRGETCTESGKEFKTFNGAKKWALNRMSL